MDAGTKSVLKRWGIGMVSTVMGLSIIAIILAGINFQYAGPNWRSGFSYYSLPGLEIACIIYSFFVAGWGYIAFYKPSFACSVSYGVFLAMSLIFDFCIGIFALVAYNIGFMNTIMGCNQAHFNGVLGIWQGIDSYLQEISSTLCSDQCPCGLTNLTAFTDNATISPYVETWNISANGAVAFQNCSDIVQGNTFKKANATNQYLDPNDTFNQPMFWKYMANMENFFQCTGWCNTTYVNSKTNKTEPMYRYMFTDVNRGPVQHVGCIDSIVNWLPGYLGSYGAITMLIGFFETAVFILVMYQCMKDKDYGSEKEEKPKENKVPNV